MINLAAVVLSIICFLGIFYAKDVIRITTPGLSFAKTEDTTILLQYFFPVILFIVLNELIASVYYAHEKFLLPLCNKLITPIVTVLYLIFFSNTLSVKSLIFAQLTGAVIQCVVLFVGLVRDTNFQYKFSFDIYIPEVRQVLKLMAPLVLFSTVAKIVPVFDRYFLSGFPQGVISYVAYAGKINLVLGTIITSIFSVQVFSLLSNYSAEKKYVEMKELFTQIVRLLLYVSIPLTFAVLCFGESLVRIIYERGVFTPEVTKAVSTCLKLYVLALPAVSVGAVVVQFYYALKDTITPMIVGVVEIVLYVVLCFGLIGHFGYFAIPVVYSVYFTFSTICLALILRTKLHAKGIGIIKRIGTFVLMSVVVFTPVYLLQSIFPIAINQTFSDFLCIAVCVLCYLLVSHLFHIPEYKLLLVKINVIKRKIIGH
jgi:putative peptidoglycan lipid II flippase